MSDKRYRWDLGDWLGYSLAALLVIMMLLIVFVAIIEARDAVIRPKQGAAAHEATSSSDRVDWDFEYQDADIEYQVTLEDGNTMIVLASEAGVESGTLYFLGVSSIDDAVYADVDFYLSIVKWVSVIGDDREE